MSTQCFRMAVLALLLCGTVGSAHGDTCECPQQNKTVDYFLFANGAKPVVDTGAATFDDCFMGYFIPAKDTTYTVIGSDGQEVEMPFHWPTTHQWDGDYLHTAPGTGDRDQWTWGLDIFGWVDKCCRIHLFDTSDKVYAWHSGTADVVTDNQIRVQDDRPAPDDQGNFPSYYHTTYFHVKPKEGLDQLDRVEANELLGTLADEPNRDPHLHISYYDSSKAKTVNPITAGLITKHTHTCPVPEPGTIALLLMGIGGLAARTRRRRT